MPDDLKPILQYYAEWKNDICAMAKNQNVFCKVSGMMTEANWKTWEREDFTPYLDIFEAFGTDRMMYGSNWPVCRAAATYGQTLAITENYVSKLSKNEQHKFWGDNALNFMDLN